MASLCNFPKQIVSYIAKVFRSVNCRLCQKIARFPNCPETSLDMTFIEELSQYSAPRVVAPGWAVRIDTHYLGGLRHFYSWEIADIGILLFVKKNSKVVGQKVALLQSKRLYPKNEEVRELEEADFRIGMGRLLAGGPSLPSIANQRKFQFTFDCLYGAIKVQDEQYNAIESYETEYSIPIYYLLYNPWEIPSLFTLPISSTKKLGSVRNGGVRVIPAVNLRNSLKTFNKNYSPSFIDLSSTISIKKSEMSGWRLEDFMSKLFIQCKVGVLFKSLDEENIHALFNRRSGPISSALAVTIEQFD